MSFYNTSNVKNFFINNPLERVYQSIENLNAAVISLSGAVSSLTANVEELMETPGGATLFFNYPQPLEFLPVEYFVPQPSFLLSSLPNESEDGVYQTFTIPPNDSIDSLYLTSPTIDPFNNYVSKGLWTSHLYLKTSNPNCLAVQGNFSVQQFNGELYFSDIANYTSVDVIPSSDPIDHVIISAVPTGVLNYSPSTIYYSNIILVNNGLTPATIQLYTSGSTSSRIETNLISVPKNKTFSWLNGYWDNELSINPVNGQFYLSNDPGPDNPQLGTVQMDSIDNYVLKINGTSFAEANLYEWFNLANYAYDVQPPCLQISNPNDPSTFWIGTCTVDYDYTYGYRGFNFVYKRTFGSDPSINRIIIYSILGNSGTTPVDDVQIDWDTDSNSDYFDIYTGDGSANPDIMIYSVLYGNTPDAISIPVLTNYFKTFVDNVVYTGGIVDSITGMQSNFTNNFTSLTEVLPPLYSFFEFLNFSDFDQDSTSGSGVDFNFEFACGRQYFPSGAHYGNNGIGNAGSGYKVGDTITFLGSNFGGVDGINDAVLTVLSITRSTGAVLSVSIAGTPAYLQSQDEINDGGDDQYDGGNSLYTDYYGGFNYGTGAVQNDIFGIGSETIVDYNNAIFVMFATNASNNSEFYIDGNVGADGDGYVDANQNAAYNIYMDNFNTSNGLMEASQIYNFSLTTDLGFSGFGLKKPSFNGKPKKFEIPKRTVINTELRAQIKLKHDVNKIKLAEKKALKAPKIKIAKVKAVKKVNVKSTISEHIKKSKKKLLKNIVKK